MINNNGFSERLQELLQLHDETASSFAQKIGVQRSSISHILSGRNKPSLDFILKILNSYEDIDLYWLINGKTPSKAISKEPKLKLKKEIKAINKKIPTLTKSIERIVIFYKDGSFQSFDNGIL